MSLSEIKSIIQIIMLVLTNGKAIIEAIGDIVEEIKSWFRADNKPLDLDDATMAALTAEVRPLMVAAKGKDVPQKKVAAAVKVLWNANPKTVKRLTRSGKTAGRTT